MMNPTTCTRRTVHLVVILAILVLTIEQLRIDRRATVVNDSTISTALSIVKSSLRSESSSPTKVSSSTSSSRRRSLPACQGDEYHVGSWVQADDYQKLDSCSWNSHRNCFTQQPGGKERIEKSMQWNWEPSSCQLHDFNSSILHTTLAIQNRRIFYFGDSLNKDMWTSLKCMMDLGENYRKFTIGVREDFLGCPWKSDDPTFGTAEYCTNVDELTEVWQKHVDTFKITSQDILVINGGFHWHMKPEYVASAYLNVANVIAKVFKGRVIVRTTVMEHEHCEKYQEPWISGMNNSTASKLSSLNDLITKAVEDSNLHDYQILYVDMFEQRPDGHQIGDNHDCLHYCVPGPIHWWNKLLYHILYDTLLFPNDDIPSADLKSMSMSMASKNVQLRNQRERIEELQQQISHIEKEHKETVTQVEKAHEENIAKIEKAHEENIGQIEKAHEKKGSQPESSSVVSHSSTLPICQGDDYHVGTWVQADEYQTFDTCSWSKHRNCIIEQPGGKERIEKSMQWNWIPSTCRLHEFNATRLQTALKSQNRRIFFFGDSLNEDMWTSLKCMMNLGEDYWDYTNDVRADFLGCPWNDPTYGTADYCKDFDKLVAVWQSHVDRLKITSRDILVINTGAHWYVKPEYAATAYLDIANAIAKVFKGHVVVRTTVMGHDDCDKFEEPLLSDSGNKTEKKQLPYNWNSFGVLNDLIKKAVEDSNLQDYQILYVDMFEQRPDGHYIADNHDCLHYCVPGPIHWWNRLLYHVLHDILFLPIDDDIPSTDAKSMPMPSENVQLRSHKERFEEPQPQKSQDEKGNEDIGQIEKAHEDTPQPESSSVVSHSSTLPICQGDDYHVGTWVQADEYQIFDTCSWSKHRNCIIEQPGGKERIEKSMQWNWIPSTCRLHEFNATRLQTALKSQKRRIFFFGDSLNEDMWTSLKCMMDLGEDYWDYTNDVREDFLGCPWKSDDPTYGTADYCKDFDKLLAVWQRHVDYHKITSRDILVINTGAHWYVKPEYAATSFLDIANAIAKVFKGHVVVRTTVMGHNDCDKFEEPLQINDKNRTEKKQLPYNWNSFGVLNDLIKKAVEDSNLQDFQILYVDMFEQRPDGHYIADNHDCLHYCVPGPIHWWNKLLYHVLHDILFLPIDDDNSN